MRPSSIHTVTCDTPHTASPSAKPPPQRQQQRSGAGHHHTQPNIAALPARRHSLSGLPCVHLSITQHMARLCSNQSIIVHHAQHGTRQDPVTRACHTLRFVAASASTRRFGRGAKPIARRGARRVYGGARARAAAARGTKASQTDGCHQSSRDSLSLVRLTAHARIPTVPRPARSIPPVPRRPFAVVCSTPAANPLG